jgi:hypothetical protein
MMMMMMMKMMMMMIFYHDHHRRRQHRKLSWRDGRGEEVSPFAAVEAHLFLCTQHQVTWCAFIAAISTL